MGFRRGSTQTWVCRAGRGVGERGSRRRTMRGRGWHRTVSTGRIDRGAAPASVPAGVHDARQLRVRAAIEGATSHPVNFRRRAAQRVFTMVLRAETLIALW